MTFDVPTLYNSRSNTHVHALTIGVVDLIRRRYRLNAALTEAVLSPEGDAVPGRKRLPVKKTQLLNKLPFIKKNK